MCDTMLSIHIYEVFLHHLSYSQCFAENYSVTLSFSFEYSQRQETYHLLSQLILFGKSSPLESASWKLAQICCCSVAQSCLTLCSPMDCSMLGFPVLHYLPEFAQTHMHWINDANHLILCHTLLFLPSVFASIRVFSYELALHIRWLKYWSFSFSVSPSNEYPGLISFRIDRFNGR